MGRRGPLGRSAAVLTAAAIALMGTACSSQRAGETGWGNDDGKIKVGLVTKTDSNPFFVALREAAKAQATKDGAELVALAGKFDGDNEGQVAALENLIQQGVDTIMITPSNSTGILGAIKKAREKGIPVIALDTETEPKDAVDATFATDNLAAGKLQGGYVKAQQAMENLLQRATDVNSVYTINEPAARGGYAALAARSRNAQVLVGSIDGGCQGVQDVKDGKYAVTVMQFPKKMAEQGVQAAVEFTKSGKKPSGFVDTGSVVITDKPVAGIDGKDTAWGLQNCWG